MKKVNVREKVCLDFVTEMYMKADSLKTDFKAKGDILVPMAMLMKDYGRQVIVM